MCTRTPRECRPSGSNPKGAPGQRVSIFSSVKRINATASQDSGSLPKVIMRYFRRNEPNAIASNIFVCDIFHSIVVASVSINGDSRTPSVMCGCCRISALKVPSIRNMNHEYRVSVVEAGTVSFLFSSSVKCWKLSRNHVSMTVLDRQGKRCRMQS